MNKSQLNQTITIGLLGVAFVVSMHFAQKSKGDSSSSVAKSSSSQVVMASSSSAILSVLSSSASKMGDSSKAKVASVPKRKLVIKSQNITTVLDNVGAKISSIVLAGMEDQSNKEYSLFQRENSSALDLSVGNIKLEEQTFAFAQNYPDTIRLNGQSSQTISMTW